MECGTVSISKWRDFFKSERTRFITAFITTFAWGLMAHAYGFLNLTISHDSLYEFYAHTGDILHRVQLGRFIVPVYQLIFHGKITLPWLNGLFSILWLAVSVWLTASIFSISDKVRICLIAGIFTVNVTVTALTATYIHDLDADMFAVMLAVGMVFLWHKGGKREWLGVPLLVLVLGLYQSMLSVSITLIIFASILSLLQGEKAKKVIGKGLQAIVIILIAGLVYLVAVKISCLIAKTELSTKYNSLTNLFQSKGSLLDYVVLVLRAYKYCLFVFLRSSRSIYEMFGLHLLLAIPTIISVIHAMRIKEIENKSKMLVLLLGVLLPLGMNIACVANGGMVHDLMLYAVWFTYLLTILLTDWHISSTEPAKKLPVVCNIATVIVLVLILATDVQTANSAYVKKDLERQATLSLMTTVNAEMNKMDGYVAGETEVLFIGKPQTNTSELFPNLSNIIGLGGASPITYNGTYNSYFHYILQTPLLLNKDELPADFKDSMVAFPEEGYMQWYDGVLVVKLSD